ncbi:MAG: hypothetical protein WAM28_00180, partial [Chlamydiales bacterium]
MHSISEMCHVHVEFAEESSIEQVVEKITQLPNPQIIIWYIGCYGLKQGSVQFYKDYLIGPVLSKKSQATFWLVDLTAWCAFKSPRGSIHKVSSCFDKINKLTNNQIKCISSACIFKKMQNVSDKFIINYFQIALCRNFIHKQSSNFPNLNIYVKEIFPSDFSLAVSLHDRDVSKSYSAFQYLEGCFLVDEIVTQLNINELVDDPQIVFALPNDELEYYRDEQHSFQKDVLFLLSKHCNSLNLRITFLPFRYGTQAHHRPY